MINIHPSAHVNTEFVTLGENVEIGPFCDIGVYGPDEPLHIPDNSTIRSNTSIYRGSTYGDYLETGHHVLLRAGLDIGENLRIGSYSSLEGGAKIGDYCRIHGRCEATNVTIGDFVRVLVGTYITDDRMPPTHHDAGPVIKDGAVLCAGSLILAGVTIGVGAYIAGQALVHKDVPDGMVWGREGKPLCHVSELSWKTSKHPWTAHYHTTYPEEAQLRITELHRKIMETAPSKS